MSNAYFNLSVANFFEDWSGTSRITVNDDWSGVPSIVGYLGDINPSGSITNTDARTLTGSNLGAVDVIANQGSFGISNGGVAEFHGAAIADPVVGFQGSGTADAPSLVLYLNATGRQNLHLDLDLRRLDADAAVQQFNIQYRLAEGDVWTNVPGGYIANAATGHISLDLPGALNGQATVQVRFMTVDASGSDAFIGMDNISVTSQAAAEGASVTINSVSITEGNSGDQTLTFTVTRSSNTGDFFVDFATGGGTASPGSDYDANAGTLHFTAGGDLTATISVTIHGDLTTEATETFKVMLSNLVNVSGNATIQGAGEGTGTIINDDTTPVAIHDIQGAGHTSPLNGAHVFTSGIVTAVDTTGARGFWIQDPNPDANDATSEAIFVFTGSVPTVQVGDLVNVEGDVNEFFGSDGNNLSITEIDSPTITVVSTGNPLPAAIVLGSGGRLVPTEVIDNDDFAVFDPAQDAIDFYESLEGMRVTLPDAQAVGPSNGNSTWVVSNQGANATGMNPAGGITISEGDLNPERVQIFYDSGVAPSSVRPNAVTGDDLGDITGILHYFGGDYEVLPTAIGSTGSGPVVLPRETTALDGDAQHITIGAFNVENLDPTDPQAKFDALAGNIVGNLGAPDIIGLEEVQDADGAGAGTNYSGQPTAQILIDAIVAAGGPRYVYVEVAPTGNNQNGGENNGNIRNGYLYNPDRVGFVSVSQITDTTPADGDTYANSRKPLVGVFTFNGEEITVIGVHNTSRLGSDALFGQNQPALNAGDARRIEQTLHIKTYVEGLVAADPDARVVVMGDFNAFQFETSLTQLESGGALTNLTNLLPANERYSYNFDGNNQQIDHMLASPELYAGAQFDIVHVNSNQAPVNQTSDHDGSVARFFVNSRPTAATDAAVVNENASVTINVLANDTDFNGDALTLIGVTSSTAAGSASVVNGRVVYVAGGDAADALKQPETLVDTLTYQVQDARGAVSTGTINVTVRGVANAPTRNGTANGDTINGTAFDDTVNGLGGNDKLTGLVGTDTLNGGLGDDTLSGGAGVDRFVFTGDFGNDIVTDFETKDVIQLSAAQFADFAAVQAAASQQGADVVITLDAAHTITLQNVALGSLQANDFLFA